MRGDNFDGDTFDGETASEINCFNLILRHDFIDFGNNEEDDSNNTSYTGNDINKSLNFNGHW